MPTITLNKKVFENLVGKKLPLDELKERISYLGTDLESIENDEITVEIFPNRPDLLSEQGFARAFSSFIGIKTGLRQYKIKKSSHRVKIDSSVASVRPYTACAIVKNLKFDNEKIKELIQIQEKLHVTYGRNRKKAAIGIYPFEKIQTPIYYKALPKEKIRFQPLESEREMTATEILNNHPAGKEYAHLLEKYDSYPVFMDSNSQILSMPPIINSHLTGKITEDTKDVFIECSGFDFETQKILLNIIVTALSDMGGEIHSMELYYENKKEITPDLAPSIIKLNTNYVNKILGLSLSEQEIKKLLERMGFSYSSKKVHVPAYRADILHPIDLVEDIAIAYGYENFDPEIPMIATIGKESDLENFKRKIRDILIGLRLLETSSYIITSKDNVLKTKMASNSIELANSINQDFNALRPSLLISLLQILSESQHHEYPHSIFEINTIFDNEDEKTNLAIAISHEKSNFTEIKQVLDSLFASLGLEYSLEALKEDICIEGRTGEIKIKNKKIGFLGEVHPEVLSNWNIRMPVSILEISLSSLFLVYKD